MWLKTGLFPSMPMSLFSVSHLQVGGQCQCKFAVAGRQCAACLPGWYGLEASNPNGCIRCNCSDVGIISISSGFPGCHQDTGQCQCKAHVTGKQTSHKHERKQEYPLRKLWLCSSRWSLSHFHMPISCSYDIVPYFSNSLSESP